MALFRSVCFYVDFEAITEMEEEEERRRRRRRNPGIPIALFLDDGLGGGTDFVFAKVNSLVVHSDLLKSGFEPNEEKSLCEPIQIITWLGVILNTIAETIKATDERFDKLNAGLVELSSRQPPRKVHVKSVASVAGQIISLSNCVVPLPEL